MDIVFFRVELAVAKSGDVVGGSLDESIENVYVRPMCVAKSIGRVDDR